MGNTISAADRLRAVRRRHRDRNGARRNRGQNAAAPPPLVQLQQQEDAFVIDQGPPDIRDQRRHARNARQARGRST